MKVLPLGKGGNQGGAGSEATMSTVRLFHMRVTLPRELGQSNEPLL